MTYIGEKRTRGPFRAVCDPCEWRGPYRVTRQLAEQDVYRHEHGVLHPRRVSLREQDVVVRPATLQRHVLRDLVRVARHLLAWP